MDKKQREQMERTIDIIARRYLGFSAQDKPLSESRADKLDALRAAYSAGQVSARKK